MRTTDRIGFKLVIKEPNAEERTVIVCPRYDGLKMNWKRESNRVYHTLDFDGNIEFWGVDFETMKNCPLRTVFELVVFVKGRGEVGRCEFRKTDCEWNIDDERCTLDISANNIYKKLADGKDNEYNVVKLGLVKKEMNLYVYPQNQVYFANDDVITLIGHTGNPAQPDVARTLTEKILGRMLFNDISRHYGVVRHEQSGEVYTFDVNINTDCTEEINIGRNVFYGCLLGERQENDSTYRLYYGRISMNSNSYVGFVWTVNGLASLSESCGFVQYAGTNRYEYRLTSFGEYYFTSTCRIWVPYVRTVSPLPNAIYNESELIHPNDITEGINNNYKTIIYNGITVPYALSHISLSTRTSDHDKGYGQIANTQLYYDTPDDDQHWVPVRKDSWMAGVSMWVGDLYVTQNIKSGYSDFKNIKDFYNFGDVIKAVVKQIDPAIKFENDTDHSAFLFGNINPVSSQPQNTLYVSQKSNILKLDYDYPAWLAPITWGKIENLLKNAFGCYWDLVERNGETHLRIEHFTFYERGGSYSDINRGTLDLTVLRDTANRQPAAGKTNKWKWDTSGAGLYSSANRYEFGWMDTQSEIFDGAPIEVPEEHRLFTGEKKEERKIEWFSSDIDFLTSVPSECSSDGFAIVMEDLTQTGAVITENVHYAGQNYELSLEYLQPKYLIQGIYAAKVKIGGKEYSNVVVAKMRTDEVSFQLPAEQWETNPVTHETHDTWVSPTELLKTDAGTGIIDSLTYNMHNGVWTATVRYNNE